jgi:uncharacterized FlaG/YvyC family protein
LGIGEAIGRIEQAKYDFSLSTYPLPEMDDNVVKYQTEAIRKVSRENYSTPISEVEDLLHKNRTAHANDDETKIKTKGEKKTEKPRQASSVNKANEKGKGGQKHKEIQKLLQLTAHKKGFGAVIEKHIGEGQHIDLVINTGEEEIACEISISTSADHEIENIQKSINSGYKTFWCVSANEDHLRQIKDRIQKLESSSDFNLHFYTADQAKQAIQSIESKYDEKVVRGYKLKKSWQDIDNTEKDRREQTFAKVTEL